MSRVFSIILAVIVVVLVAICTVLPKKISEQYNLEMARFIDEINRFPAYQIQMNTIEQSWASSTALVQLTLDPTKLDFALAESLRSKGIEQLKGEFLVTGHFGPLLLSQFPAIGLFAVDVQLINSNLSEFFDWQAHTPFYEMRFSQGLSGGLSFQDKLTSFSDKFNQFSFAGYEGQASWSSSLTYEGVIKGIESIANDAPFSIDNIAIQYEADVKVMQPIRLFDGDFKIALDKMNSGDSVNLETLLLSIQTDNDTANQVSELTADISAGAFTFEEITVSNLTLSLLLANLNNQMFEKLDSLFDSLNNGASANAFWSTFFATSPELNISQLIGTLPTGNFQGELSGRLTNATANIGLVQLQQPRFWRQNAMLDSRLKADKGVAESISRAFVAHQLGEDTTDDVEKYQGDFLLSTFIQQGLIKEIGEQYSSEIGLEYGEVSMNGRLIPFF